jgi:multisubunit Na+/H+ antiporter MnhB subunit
MQYFPLVDLQHWVLAIFLGWVSLILIYLAFGSHARREKGAEGERAGREILFGQDVEKNPIAPILIFVYLGVLVFAVAYLILIGIHGSAF